MLRQALNWQGRELVSREDRGSSVRLLRHAQRHERANGSSVPGSPGRSVHESSYESEDLVKADHYDSFAESYSTDNESNLLNGYYERPAMIDLAGDVNGHRVLDAGCGSGPLSAALRAKGAIVTGFDSSSAMVELARQRLGENAALHVADLSQPLPFADGAFDDVVASLVLHYLQDWTAPLAELRRVLKPGGRLLLSVNHPIIYKLIVPKRRLLRHHAVFGGVHLQWPERGADVLASAVARDDGRVHRGGLPHLGHQ